MPKFPSARMIKTTPEFDVSGDGVVTLTMGINPVAFHCICLRPLNDTGTVANFPSYMSIVSALDKVEVLRNGYPIISASGADIAANNWLRRGVMPYQGQHAITNNERRCVVLPLFYGKMPVDPTECLPGSVNGELQIRLTIDDADTGYDDMRISIESYELPDAKPKSFERLTTFAKTHAATGEQVFDIPPANLIRAIQLWGTTGFGGASPAPSWGELHMKMDGERVAIYQSDWEVLQSLPAIFKSRGAQPYDAHVHGQTANTDVVTIGSPYNVGTEMRLYNLLDFDPNWDDKYCIDTDGAKTFQLIPNVETADAVRVLVTELMSTSRL